MINRYANIVVLSYSIANEIYFISSVVIIEGLLTIKSPKNNLINQKILTNCNEDHISVPKNIKTVIISIVAENINYRKILKL